MKPAAGGVKPGLPPDLGVSITRWDRHVSSMSMLVLVLIVLGAAARRHHWCLPCFFNTGMPSTTG